MGIRNERKKETRDSIIKSTKNLLFAKGLVKVSTKDIATSASVAQGSIFLHFQSKENLLHEIISSDLNELENEINSESLTKVDREKFLDVLLDIIGKHENMLSRVYKDYPYLSESHKKTVDTIQTVIKNKIFDNIRSSSGRKLSIVDSFINIDAFYSQVKDNLLDKEVYTEFNSIIRQRRGKLVKLYRTLFE